MVQKMEQVERIELSSFAWQANILTIELHLQKKIMSWHNLHLPKILQERRRETYTVFIVDFLLRAYVLWLCHSIQFARLYLVELTHYFSGAGNRT